jgi:hypothetical protein
MMCRVVADRYDPNFKYAPGQPVVQEIIPDILPEPQVSTDRKECLAYTRDSGTRAKLAQLFHWDVERNNGDQIKLESETVKRYTLDHPEKKFTKLMEDPRYAVEVSDLLKGKRPHRAYLVTGFMTTTNTTWSSTSSQTASNGVDVSLPIGAIAEITAGVHHTTRASCESKAFVAGEEIFAVAYNVVVLKGGLRRTSQVPVIGDVVWATNKDAAFSTGRQKFVPDDSENESSGSDGGEDETIEPVVGMLLEEPVVVKGLDRVLEVDVEPESPG